MRFPMYPPIATDGEIDPTPMLRWSKSMNCGGSILGTSYWWTMNLWKLWNLWNIYPALTQHSYGIEKWRADSHWNCDDFPQLCEMILFYPHSTNIFVIRIITLFYHEKSHMKKQFYPVLSYTIHLMYHLVMTFTVCHGKSTHFLVR